ncbi:chemotaxis protein [Malaciobacter molluscorum]|uniref:HAMP domain-containing methyl-accepting chemotaxis protein n=1 Tax=Malaciobacter molluscorum TaxID=1032072 RepID=UPI00100C0D5C|nr:methyl-accepting chemotaxis protein [Malaciobacter molluscorum]RXJ93496.1 chemotaxis protein [Malaciobacter molluscorum]
MNNYSTKLKLSILIIVSLISLLTLGIMSVIQLQKVNAGLETVYNDRVIPLKQLKIVADEYAVKIVDTTHQTRNGNFSYDKCIENIDNAQSAISENWNKYISTKLTQKEEKLSNNVQELMKEGTEISNKIKEACKQKDNELISKITINELYQKIDPIGEKIAQLIQLQLDIAKNENDKASIIYENSKIITIVTIAISLCLILFLAFMIISDITKKLNLFKKGLISFFSYLNKEQDTTDNIQIKSRDEFGQMADVVNKNIERTKDNVEKDKALINEAILVLGEFEQGDLSQRLKTNVNNPALTQLKEVLNKMADNLETNIDNILKILSEYSNYNYLNKISTDKLKQHLLRLANGVNDLGNATTSMLVENKMNGLTLDESSNILLANVDKLNDSSTEAASSLEETAAALEEITSNIRNNTENISKMSSFSDQVNISATKGEELANETTVAMDDINQQVNSINEAITVIDQIAFQTNILSLNAAVEAATAGEAGKGFAVVAAEVRNLASRSAQAAKEIKSIVENATVKANSGKNIATAMIEGYKVLNENIFKTTELITDIKNASKEQLLGIEQINDAVNQLDQQTQKNAMVASQTNDVASITDDIAKLIVKKADEKQFIGKDEVKAMKFDKKQDSKENKNKTNIQTKPIKEDNEEWENF